VGHHSEHRPQYSHLAAALTAYFSAKVGSAGRCTLADPGRIRGDVDPSANSDRIAEIAVALAQVAIEGRVALELETLHAHLPVRFDPDAKPAKNMSPVTYGKLDVMTREFGGTWYERKYGSVVKQARDEAAFQLARRGLIPEPSWFNDEKQARGMA